MKEREALGVVFRFFLSTRTQKEIALKGQLSQTEVSFFNKGQRMPREKKMNKLAKGLGRRPEEMHEAIDKIISVVRLSRNQELLEAFGKKDLARVGESSLDDEEMEILTNTDAGKMKEYLDEKIGKPELIYPMVRVMKPFFYPED